MRVTNKPVICFDFDGTLVDKGGRIHPNDVEILNNEKRAVFVPATGRPLQAVRRAFNNNGVVFGEKIPFPMILQNGAVVYLPGEELLVQTSFLGGIQDKILDIARCHSQACCLLFALHQSEAMWLNAHARRMIERFDLDVLPFQAGSFRYSKIMFIGDDRSVINTVVEATRSFPVETAYSLPTVYEITPEGIDKGRMLANLVTEMGLQSTKIVVAGDGENDLPLFDVAGVSFCPEESVPAVKKKADHVLELSERGVLAPMLEITGML